MPAVTFRLVGPADDLAVAATLVREYVEWATAIAACQFGIDLGFTSEEYLRATLETLRAPGGRLYVAELDGPDGPAPVGVGGMKPLGPGEAELKRMYVRPAARGAGVGKALLRRLIADARTAGVRTLRLESSRFMPEALALYEQHGFAFTDEYPGREFHGFEPLDGISVFMALDLTAAPA